VKHFWWQLAVLGAAMFGLGWLASNYVGDSLVVTANVWMIGLLCGGVLGRYHGLRMRRKR